MRSTAVSAILLFVFAAISSLGLSLTAPASAAAYPQAKAQEQSSASDQADLKTFSGKIVSLNGAMFILRDDVNEVWYHLDDQAQAGKFAGKDVDVKGTLDGRTDMIHVQSIAVESSSSASGGAGH